MYIEINCGSLSFEKLYNAICEEFQFEGLTYGNWDGLLDSLISLDTDSPRWIEHTKGAISDKHVNLRLTYISLLVEHDLAEFEKVRTVLQLSSTEVRYDGILFTVDVFGHESKVDPVEKDQLMNKDMRDGTESVNYVRDGEVCMGMIFPNLCGVLPRAELGNYKVFDVHPKETGINRGGERLVRNMITQDTYCTFTHFSGDVPFIKLED